MFRTAHAHPFSIFSLSLILFPFLPRVLDQPANSQFLSARLHAYRVMISISLYDASKWLLALSTRLLH